MKAPYLQIGTRWSPWRFWLVMVAGVGVLGFNFGSRLLLTNDDTRFLPDLALSFKLDRLVVMAKTLRTLEGRARWGTRLFGHLGPRDQPAGRWQLPCIQWPGTA